MSVNVDAPVSAITVEGISIPIKSTTVYDALDSTDSTYALSANQGRVLDEKIQSNTQLINDRLENLVVPTKTSELENDSDYITTENLNTYYTKEETYSKEEIENLIQSSLTNSVTEIIEGSY
jgi:hypothetical protein